MTEPGGVDLHHPWRAESLQVTVDAADGRKHPEQAPKRGEAEKHIHDGRTGRADEHGALSAEAVGEQAVNDLATSVGEQRGRNDGAHLALGKTERFADRAVRE